MVSQDESPLEKAERQLRAASLTEAKITFSEISVKDVVRKDLYKYANLARRLGLNIEAIQVLRPFVRPKDKNPQEATPKEKNEYAMALIKLGALNEALKLLESIDAEKHPEAWLYSAFAKITQWKYNEASLLLEKFIEHPSVDPYAKLTAQANLLSTYVFNSSLNKARLLFTYLMDVSKEDHAKRIRGSILYLGAQINILDKDFTAAELCLSEASHGVSRPNSLENLLVDKWKLVLALSSEGPNPQNLAALEPLKKRAIDLKNYETIREIDFYSALFKNDKHLLEHVYFGTPFPTYRKMILSRFKAHTGEDLELSQTYNWCPGDSLNIIRENTDYVEVSTGFNSFGDAFLKKGMLTQRLFKLLASDFYRPVGIYQICNEVFDQQFVNPVYSFDLVTQLVFRLNEWCRQGNIPINIKIRKEVVYVDAPATINFKVELEEGSDPRVLRFVDELRGLVGNNEFTASQISDSIDIARRTVARYLSFGVNDGLIEKKGAGPKTKYKIRE